MIRQSFDLGGAPVWEPPGPRDPANLPADGTTLIGPMPHGIATLVVDVPPFARTRLPDVRVTGASPLIDAGTVKLAPGAVLHVTLVDEKGAPVPHHQVRLQESRLISPVMLSPVRTDADGRATFGRLAPGKYRLLTSTVRLCGDRILTVARPVDVPAAGTVHMRVVLGGTFNLRLTSGGASLAGTTVLVTTESPAPSPPPWLRDSGRLPAPRFRFEWFSESPCTAWTDATGAATLPNMPPGPARLDVRLPHSTWTRRLDIPGNGRELTLEVPPGVLHEISLDPAPDTTVHCRLAGDGGKPLAGAVVELGPSDPLDVAWIATADAEGLVRFHEVWPGSVRLQAWEDGYAPWKGNLAAHARSRCVIQMNAR